MDAIQPRSYLSGMKERFMMASNLLSRAQSNADRMQQLDLQPTELSPQAATDTKKTKTASNILANSKENTNQGPGLEALQFPVIIPPASVAVDTHVGNKKEPSLPQNPSISNIEPSTHKEPIDESQIRDASNSYSAASNQFESYNNIHLSKA
jgi:hypothetical protein